MKELKGFIKVDLEPDEVKTIEFTLSERDFAFYHPYVGKWIVEPGKFEILIGSSSRDIRLVGTIHLF
jgi:beta-glucosidase